MGVCLSKGHRHHQHGQMRPNDEDSGFCTPEGVSLQYESRNPSGRYSFAHLETPRISAEVGDSGALGSLFYKRGSWSRENNNTTTTTTTTVASNYISPLDMFLGGVRVRNRVHHVNQICAGDFSFASYLASPLLKGFDVHAMEAVAKSYAESAAKAAARDAFVFLEENDMSVAGSGRGDGFQDAEERNVSTSSDAPAAGDTCGDVDDDLAKSGESEEWEEPKKVENCWVVQNQTEEAETNKSSSRSGQEEAETDRFNKPSPRFREGDAETNTFSTSSTRFRESSERGTNERWVSVINAVQARAKARRKQRRKSFLGKTHGGGPERFLRSGSGRKQKSVRFRLAGVDERFTDDDIRSGKESEYDQAPPQDKAETDVVLSDNNSAGEEVKACAMQQQHPEEEPGSDCIQCVERSGKDIGNGESLPMAEEECDSYYIWQDGEEEEEEEENGGEEEDRRYGKEKIIEAEFLGFTFTASGRFTDEAVREPKSEGGGAETPLMNPRTDGRHVRRPSLDSLSSSSEYFLPDTSFGSSEQMEEERQLEDFTLPPGMDEEEDDEAMGSGNHVPRAPDDEEDETDFRTDEGEDSRECCPAGCGECEAAFPPGPSGDDGYSTYEQEMPSSSFMKDISISNDTTGPPPAIPVGCVVVESRLPDGSRLTPRILEVGEVRLPERGEGNYGLFHTRVLCHGGEASPPPPPPSGSDFNPGLEGSFSFPVLLQPSSSIPPPGNSSRIETEQRGGGLWRAPPLRDPETPIKNRSIVPHLLPPPQPLLPPTMSATPERQIHEISTSPPKKTVVSDESTTTTSYDPTRCSFPFETEQTATCTKKAHKIFLPTVSPRSMSPSPVFAPSKVTTASLRSTVAAAASSSPFLSTIHVASGPHPPRARRTLTRKLKFYSLERASYAAAGVKRSNSSKSPPSLSRQSRERRRETDGDSDSDLFEIETMSGTNAMGSSRTPPPTPTKSPGRWMAPGPASIDLDELGDSIARVSRSRSSRSANNATGKPLAQSRDPKARCLPVERRKDSSSSIFQGRNGGATIKRMPHSSLKGRALLKLGLLMRSTKPQQPMRIGKDSNVVRSSETFASEYLENRAPSPAGGRYHHPHGQCGQCLIEKEERAAAAAANHNYGFDWYCSSTAQRVAPLHHENRLQQQQGFSSHKSFSNEDGTFALKN